LWPFSSHRLFSQLPLVEKPIVQAKVEDADGYVQFVHPGRVIPIEYSRCSGLVRNIFRNGTSKQKSLLSEYLVERLNKQPWGPFDEVFSAVSSPTGAPFIRVEFEIHVVTFAPRQVNVLRRESL